MLDIVLRGGHVVDGTGRARFEADVGIVDGRIADIGRDVGQGRREIDVHGRVVSPGFVDVHSHFDAQVFWDPGLTPSSLHGVTTTISGNCGFTLAPLADHAADYLLRMLAVVEGMPLEALRQAVPCDWSSTAAYLGRLDGGLAVNVGFMVGHSALRAVVMGADATQRRATTDELAEMTTLLRAGLDAGGLGFSSSWSVAHFDGDGRPVPSIAADRHELVELAAACRDHEGTSLEFLPSRVDRFDAAQLDLLTTMSARAARPLNWNVVRITEAAADKVAGVLAAADHARNQDARVVALAMPIPSRARFSFLSGFVLDALPRWAPVMALPPTERLDALRDPAVRVRLRRGADSAPGLLAEVAEWGERIIAETFDPRLDHYKGRLVADIAAEEGKTALDALLDIVCADELRTSFTRPPTEPTRGDWQASASAWRDGRALIGASDAGAHLDFTAYFDYPVYVLQKAVRDHRVLSLEEAVHFLTEVPARLYGLRRRGTVELGNSADIVVFDEATISIGEITTRFDLPTGAGRLYAEPAGIDLVMVNGETVVEHNELSGATPGVVVRSGVDTATPPMD